MHLHIRNCYCSCCCYYHYYYNKYYYYCVDIDNCSPNPCQNGGACTDEVAGYSCSCAAGYTGINCETGKIHFR